MVDYQKKHGILAELGDEKMNILKSFLVFLLLGVLAGSSGLMFMQAMKYNISNSKKKFIFPSAVSLIAVMCIIIWGDYVYPFEREVEPVLFAEFSVPEEFELEYPGQKFWHGAYEQYGLYAESFYFDPDENTSMYGFGWPPMDFQHHCYIITYGQTIKTLTYNVWDTIDIPIKTGAKVGHMTLNEEFYPDMIYIYQIPKIRIDNDINDPALWDY